MGGYCMVITKRKILFKLKQITMKRIRLFAYLMTGMAATAFMTSCGDDDVALPAEPTITVTADGLVEGQLTGNVGDDVALTIATETAGGFASLTITEYQGTDAMDPEVSTTEVTSYTHTITVDDIDAPFRINFAVTDIQGRTATTDVIITGQRTNLQKLQDFNWQYTSQMGILDGEGESIKGCETDNVYSFNVDGSATIDFGTDTATGDCWLDGLTLATGFTYDEAEGTLSIAQEYFQPDFTFADGDPKVYTNVTFDGLTFTGRTIYDLSALFGLPPGSFLWEADESYTAVTK